MLTGTRRSDDLYTLLRSLGWLYRRSAGDYRLQASQDRPAKTGAIARTADALRQRDFTVTTVIDTAARPVTDAEAERAEDRAERLQGRAERLHADAAARENEARQMLDHIPPGQPYLTDSSGYAADRRRRERAFDNQSRSVQLDRDADTAAAAARTAAGHMAARYHPATVANRIRDIDATCAGSPAAAPSSSAASS